LTTFGETQIEVGGRVELAAGSRLDTHFVDIRGGSLAGNGIVFAGAGPFRSPVRNLSGRIEPGAPVGTLTIDGDLSQQSGGTLAIDLGGTLASQYDRLAVGRLAFLDGTLEVSLVDLGGGLFTPSVGNSFTILTAADGIEGTFEQLLLPGGFQWNVAYNANNVVLSVTGLGLAGDFNHDSRVDSADYVTWREGLGTIYNQGHYNEWRANFGATSGTANSAPATAAVPEPESWSLVTLGAVLFSIAGIRRLTR
jgi:hypothetical protein